MARSLTTLPKPKMIRTGLDAKPDFLVNRLPKPTMPVREPEEQAPEPEPEPERKSKITVITGETIARDHEPAVAPKASTSIYERWARRIRKPANLSMQDGVAQILAFNEWIERDRPVFRHPFMAPLVRVDKLPSDTKKAIMHIWANGTDDDRRRLLINDPPDTTGDIEHTEPEEPAAAGTPAAGGEDAEPVPVDKAGARLIKKLQALQEREGAADGDDKDESVAMVTMPIIIVHGRLNSRTQRALAMQRACMGRMESYTTIGKCQVLSLDRDFYNAVLAEMSEAGNDEPTFQDILAHLRRHSQKAYRAVPRLAGKYNLIAPVNTPHVVKNGRVYVPLMPAVFNDDGSYIDSWTFPRK